MLANYVPSLIRTGAALLAGWLLSLPLAHPVLVLLGQDAASPTTKEKLVAALTAILTAAWYAIVHAAEKHWPVASLLLASTKQPVAYAPAADGGHVFTRLPDPFEPGPGSVPADMPLNPATASAATGNHAAPDNNSPADPSAMGGPSAPTTPAA